MSAHTPGPWQTLRRDSGWDITGTMRKGYTREIAVVFSRGDDVQQANALHIVRCVNAHDDLLAALRAAVSLLRAWHDEPDSATAYRFDLSDHPQVAPILAAIAKAEGKS